MTEQGEWIYLVAGGTVQHVCPFPAAFASLSLTSGVVSALSNFQLYCSFTCGEQRMHLKGLRHPVRASTASARLA